MVGLRARGVEKACAVLPLYLEGLLELVAQLVEQRTFNAWVSGSIPDELTTPLAANPFCKFRTQLQHEVLRGCLDD